MSCPLFSFSFCFDCNGTEPIPHMQIPSETENEFLKTAPPVPKSSVHNKGDAEYSHRYSQTNTLFKVEVRSSKPSYAA